MPLPSSLRRGRLPIAESAANDRRNDMNNVTIIGIDLAKRIFHATRIERSFNQIK
jgi:hypothetical protein